MVKICVACYECFGFNVGINLIGAVSGTHTQVQTPHSEDEEVQVSSSSKPASPSPVKIAEDYG